jgi:hypothetical protein
MINLSKPHKKCVDENCEVVNHHRYCSLRLMAHVCVCVFCNFLLGFMNFAFCGE